MSGVADRAKAALGGIPEDPWMASGGVVWREDIIAVSDPSDPSGQTPMPQQVQEKVADSSSEVAQFIAEARSLVPELVAEVERLQHELWDAARRIRGFATDCTNHGDMTPAAKRQWHALADTIHRAAVKS